VRAPACRGSLGAALAGLAVALWMLVPPAATDSGGRGPARIVRELDQQRLLSATTAVVVAESSGFRTCVPSRRFLPVAASPIHSSTGIAQVLR